jgi:uncharacterized protein YndB with AHSA1/START domain
MLPDLAAIPDDRRLELERILPAPRELVWKMFSDPCHLAQWWGPKGCTNPVVELDFRVGGRWYHVMHCLDDKDYPADSEFVEITPPERIVYRNRRLDDAAFGDNPPPSFLRVINFIDLGDGRTRVKIEAYFDTSEEKAAVVRRGFREGVMESFDKLIAYLEGGAK